MYDRPTLKELLEAVQVCLEEQVIPAVKADVRLYYHTLVSINLLKIAGRELDLGLPHMLAEWERLNGIQGTDFAPPVEPEKLYEALVHRNENFAEAIRQGAYDDSHGRAALLAHFLATTREQLEVANPKHLQMLGQENAARS